MTLYLSSDEQTLDESNTRTKFKNRILPDFFENNSFNLKLHEIFFDSKFPTLANFEYPHIITTVIGSENKLQDFPDKFQKNSLTRPTRVRHTPKTCCFEFSRFIWKRSRAVCSIWNYG